MADLVADRNIILMKACGERRAVLETHICHSIVSSVSSTHISTSQLVDSFEITPALTSLLVLKLCSTTAVSLRNGAFSIFTGSIS